MVRGGIRCSEPRERTSRPGVQNPDDHGTRQVLHEGMVNPALQEKHRLGLKPFHSRHVLGILQGEKLQQGANQPTHYRFLLFLHTQKEGPQQSFLFLSKRDHSIEIEGTWAATQN